MRLGGSRLKPLLIRGANINAKDTHARGPLHVTAIEGNDNIYKLLLDIRLDTNGIDNSGRNTRQYFANAHAPILGIN